MKRFLLLILLAAVPVKAQDAPVKTCDKLPYRLGHIVYLSSTDLRDHPRGPTKKESKEMDRKIAQLQAECNAFVSRSPGHPVSKDVSYTIKGFVAYYERCESFCGTDKDLSEVILKYGADPLPPQK
jgi:hypothetical protein